MRLLIVVIVIAVVPAFVDAQTSYGLAGGVSLIGPQQSPRFVFSTPYEQTYSPGPTLMAFLSRPMSRRLALRLEASVSEQSFRGVSSVAIYSCSGDPCPPPSVEFTQWRFNIASVTASAVYALHSSDRGVNLYLIGGAGPYHVSDNPAVGSMTRLGVGAGVGCTVSLRGRKRAFAEARYQRVLGAPTYDQGLLGPSIPLGWIAPVTVGLRF
jgi:hypothetical protein